jgi:predicted permease
LYVETADEMSGGQQWVRAFLPYPVFMHMAAALGQQKVAAYSNSDSVGIEAPIEFAAKRTSVSADFFSVLGVRLRLGRGFTAEDGPDRPRAVVVISEDLWRRVFRRDPSVVGRTMSIDGRTLTVVGVAGGGFTGVDLDRVDLWVPLGFASRRLDSLARDTWYTRPEGFEDLRIVARVPNAVVPPPIEAAITAQLRADDAAGTGFGTRCGSVTFRRLCAAPVTAILDGPIAEAAGPVARDAETSVALRIAAVAVIVLLIACANVTNLLLLRGVRRSREIAVRRALGVSRARLASHVLLEGLLVAGLGGVAAVIVAFGGGTLLRRLLFPSISWSGGVLDLRTLGCLAGLAVVAGLIAGLAPALTAANPDVMALLRRGSQDGSRAASIRSGLVILQTALSVTLLVGATLFIRSLFNAKAIGVGYNTREVVFAGAALTRFEPPKAIRARATQLERIANDMRAFPGVRSTAMASTPPLGTTTQVAVYRPGADSMLQIEHLPLIITAVTAAYFETTGIPILEGRTLSEEDVATAAPVLVVSRRMARAVWPGQSAIGQCLILRLKTSACMGVVGVVGDAHVDKIVEPPTARFYMPFGAGMIGVSPSIIVRATPASLGRVERELRERLTSVVPKHSRVRVMTLAQVLEPELRPWLVGAQLFTALGVIALVVAAVGVYSVTSYAMSQRTHEIGVRLAFGARTEHIFRLAALRGLAVLLVGAVLGVFMAAVLGRFVTSLLFGITPTDVPTLAGAALILVVVGVLAGIEPAWRASRIDPVRTLATE